jgi:hypothetical protein
MDGMAHTNQSILILAFYFYVIVTSFLSYPYFSKLFVNSLLIKQRVPSIIENPSVGHIPL